ncbi:hypothetical protein HanRHA438_Chr09g0392121 [Helianthus annuus]|uniref:Uncharacterized protein n=1 Tax=Helianthus annuus TaxID=4232 RepID=A0A9K3I5F0_HELAN|nr:hypothetical protein HanXRQr2_Chr09g0380431 [Helianthus annuus]KAJ0525453.1 hypothetical protein HanHA300_Chr09g0312221 [Helianthus annuus]KAJ0541844.1 hypothetical protein HanHA89_Chr09g0333161 [Helianthus annuus]KAJ0706919.1 hypothetical protein HanLR1_Chr09g0312611 [Helianthus annuus]KAJ0710938.1 hypothetical protein HanOQP8_Chr09g0318181 [Helianthus annuus]
MSRAGWRMRRRRRRRVSAAMKSTRRVLASEYLLWANSVWRRVKKEGRVVGDPMEKFGA